MKKGTKNNQPHKQRETKETSTGVRAHGSSPPRAGIGNARDGGQDRAEIPQPTGERLYTPEELAKRFGVDVEELMAIAGHLGIIGDPRYGRWVPNESSDNKKPKS